ncbi:hypothetical protein GCM10027186_36250 [Micromonospora schwarzwaldensis]
MWDYDSFIAKSRLYFQRAEKHPRVDDDVFALWLLLGLEFLLRAPLAKVNKTLLADMNPDSIMHAAGFPMGVNSKPTSVAAKTVITRLGVIIGDFTKERQDDATILIGMRNGELHSSESPLTVDVAQWLPQFTRVVEVICVFLDIDSFDLVGQELIEQGRALVDGEDRKLAHEIQKRVEAARARYGQLADQDRVARRAMLPRRSSTWQWPEVQPGDRWASAVYELVDCSACNESAPLFLRAVRSTNERLEEDEIYRDIVYVATELTCLICDLELHGTAEIRCVGLQQQYVRQEVESIQERFMSTYEPDYGND